MIQARHTAVRTLLMLIAVACTHAGCASESNPGGFQTEGLYDTNIHTVAVPIFANRTFYREAEFKLTEALTKEIELRTPYKVTKSGSADTVLTGTILNVDKRLLSRQYNTGLAQEVQVVVTVSFEWKDLRTGKVIRKRSRFQGTGEYMPSRVTGEPFEVAQHEAIGELARDIVSAMRSDW
ncbi:MAG: hypothetical protein GC159_16790 [Phycisphaera sp.]|nr:hypothetical protein [Phycisphaera sp.]